MAHYRIIIFHDPAQQIENAERIGLTDTALSHVDGFFQNEKLILLDTVRWLLPELSPAKQAETFRKLLEKEADEASRKGYVGSIKDWHI